MSHASVILGITELEVERVDRDQGVEVYAKPTQRPACIHRQHPKVTIKATRQPTLKHTRDHPKRATNVTYTIDNGALSQSVQVDQTANGGAWQLLGTYTLDAAQAVTVTLTNDANDTVVADGVELRKIGGSTAPALFYYHNDHLGTPQRLTDASGSLAWDADYQPFGETDAPNSSVGQALRFPGQFADGETGFNYNYFRTYDPSIGRYTQSDPIGLQGGLNTYAYVGGNPLNYIDMFGLERGKRNVRDTGLADLTDEEVSARARDKSVSKAERRRAQREEKARKQRNKQKRDSGKSRKGDPFLRSCLNFLGLRGVAELLYPSPERACDIHNNEPQVCDLIVP